MRQELLCLCCCALFMYICHIVGPNLARQLACSNVAKPLMHFERCATHCCNATQLLLHWRLAAVLAAASKHCWCGNANDM